VLDSKRHDSSEPDHPAVVAAEAAIEQHREAMRNEREQRIDAALSRLRYGTILGGGGFQWSGGLLRLR